jgi:hypothetical protein
MVPLASLLRPWMTASSSSDSESSTRLHHSSYLVILLISSSILSGPTFPIVVFSRNLSKRFSHRGFPSRVPIDRGRVKAPVVGSFYTSRRTASKVGQRSRTCVLVIVVIQTGRMTDNTPRFQVIQPINRQTDFRGRRLLWTLDHERITPLFRACIRAGMSEIRLM